MDVIILFTIILILVARRNGAYHPDMKVKKAIDLTGKKYKRIFIPKRSGVYKNAPEENKNMYNIVPLVMGIIVFVVSVVALIIDFIGSRLWGEEVFFAAVNEMLITLLSVLLALIASIITLVINKIAVRIKRKSKKYITSNRSAKQLYASRSCCFIIN